MLSQSSSCLSSRTYDESDICFDVERCYSGHVIDNVDNKSDERLCKTHIKDFHDGRHEYRGKKLSPLNLVAINAMQHGREERSFSRGVINFYAIRVHRSAAAYNSRMDSQKIFD